MKVEIKYFGMLAEITGCSTERFTVVDLKMAGLKKELLKKYPDFANTDFRMAQNKELVTDTTLLTGKEIAVLPPFAGG